MDTAHRSPETGWRREIEVLEELARAAFLDQDVDRYELHIEAMQRHGDLVVVMGHDVVSDAPGLEPVLRRYTNVWRIAGGSWQMVARHASLAAD